MDSNEQKEIRNSLIELTSLVKQLALNNATQSSIVPNVQFSYKQSVVCSICSSQDHMSELCLNLHQDESLAAFSRAQQQKYDPHSSTYNPGWRDHLNLRYDNSFYQQPSSNHHFQQFQHTQNFQQSLSFQQGFQQQFQPYQYNFQQNQPNQHHFHNVQNSQCQPASQFQQQALPTPSRLSLTQGGSNNVSSSDSHQEKLEKLMQYMMQQQQNQQRTDSALQNIERQIGHLASSINQIQAQGSSQLPSQTTPNPKGNVSALTLRSGRRISDFSSEETVAEKLPEIQQPSSSSEEFLEAQDVPTSSSTPIYIDPFNLEHSQGSGNLMPENSSNICPADQIPTTMSNSSKSGNSGYQNSLN
ncbi:uncharacterized protein LOC122052170 [Zingiber officinale]|uniref:uncharacterized protein LOC122052170 n=1 Tax=Zingiber officinale TaxID=94328 RepID=UPI001C4B6C55|nr:uncharacterized protein LOC122052170 [Zingiber officinale]XP_042469506.1 uncharacterized protein LOC122052170 [Zingiber officinale]XP_042469507.1 uncharacterized protein LOC122052170 [Zingiber officinale]